jgi:hypothetical protein
VPDPTEVQRIVAIRDPVLRNLEITHCYWRLAQAVAQRTGTGANWCTFATWASKQAGSTIRGEDAEGLLHARLGRRAELLHPVQSLWRTLLRRGLLDPDSRLGRIVAGLHTPFDALERASDAVARGNRKVFEEIGFEFAHYLAECPADAPVDSPEVQTFLGSLGPEELRRAFTRYQRAAAEPSAQSLLTANLEIGLHEQTRLQPEIREALDAAYATSRDLGWIAKRIERQGAKLAREVITRSLMVLSLPGRVLWLGSHLADPYPAALETITDQELEAMIARFEPVAPAADDCGARDWSVLEERMHYILHLFRSWHEQPDLADPPFTAAQLARIAAGTIPDGDL